MTTDIILEKKKVTSKDLKKPPKFKVIVFNDDYTPMEFVVAMFMKVFKHNETTSVNLTMDIHNKGSAIAGVYPYEIAEQKIIDATTLARNNNYPLLLKAAAE
jgi:ATP-dependent Clp protease adaptor protein ClpS